MTATAVDFIVVGGGIAGLSVAYELAAEGSVAVLEAESAPGYHATGRSAAVLSENYGPALWSRLVTASRAFLERPPEGFAPVPLVGPRGALFLAMEHEKEALRDQAAGMAGRGAAVELMPAGDATRLCPVLRTERFALALFERDCLDIDTDALMTGYGRGLRARGGRLHTDARVGRLSRRAGTWTAVTAGGTFEAPVIVNAAGGWARDVAALAGIGPREVVPFRRSAATFDPPAGTDIRHWPMTFDVAETFYFKPEAGRVMVSPVDMAACEPCDAQADELEVAIAVDRIQAFTSLEVRAIRHRWGGLRTFAPDHEPVIGPDPAAEGFVWLAGQGGNGVMAAAAAARLAAGLATGRGVPGDLAALGITADGVSPGRPCVSAPEVPTEAA
ncbi:FAD-dependent oxidoreductase [Thalassobaculum sp.]|uniref:NAD(P)/FAD-dependent oxidoreductase n=1 Tax=Thalassobaculum sp. TaxID=2022740 RepID=UPI0032EEBE5C